jgi:nucleotide-binding universal stress UspA family protein
MSTAFTVLEAVKQEFTFKNILVATDFSEASQRALTVALALTRRYGSELLVVHAIPPAPKGPVPLDPLPRALDRDQIESEQEMHTFVRAVETSGIRYRTALAHGRVRDVISAAITGQETDLLVLGTHGRGALKKLAIGSVAEELLRLADCPVLTVGPKVTPADSHSAELRTVLLATDFGPASTKALHYALGLAERAEGRLVLVHMLPPLLLAEAAYAPAVFAADDLQQWRMAMRDEAEKKLKALVSPASLVKEPAYVIGLDLLPEGILTVAAEHDADLIVMGANRRTSPWFSSHIPWSLTHHVLCNAQCPVMTLSA